MNRKLFLTVPVRTDQEQIKDMIYQALTDDLLSRGIKIRGIMERNDVNLRTLEGLEEGKGWYTGGGIPCPDDRENTRVEITENGIKYDVDYINGQKTGFFLDQKYNRLAVGKIAKGRRVLDCFTHTGAFALNAAMGGAERVTAVDISAQAIELAKANAARNGIEMDFIIRDEQNIIPVEVKASDNSTYSFNHSYETCILISLLMCYAS